MNVLVPLNCPHKIVNFFSYNLKNVSFYLYLAVLSLHCGIAESSVVASKHLVASSGIVVP